MTLVWRLLIASFVIVALAARETTTVELECTRCDVLILLEDQAFPVFRNGVRSLADGSMRWWLWDGKTEVPVTSLTPEQRHYPLRATWNDTMLLERICSGWTHAHDVQ